MELKNNLFTDDGWQIYERQFDPEQFVTTGSNYLIGNGYLGYRGTFVEWEADRFVGCNVTDTWDTAEGSEWRELCNVPNGLFTQLFVEGEQLSGFEGETLAFYRQLGLRYGLYEREHTWQGAHHKPVKISVERFASYDNLHLIAMRYQITAEQDTEIVVLTGIDGRVWSLNGEHFKSYRAFEEDGLIAVETVTGEFGIQIDVVEGLAIEGVTPVDRAMVERDKHILRGLTFRLEAGDTLSLFKYMVVYSSNDDPAPCERALADARAALATGYEALKAAHMAHWDRIWNISDIEIGGNLEVQAITRFNLYHATIATPAHAKLPIGARGLSCQVYQGAAFWDQETFNMPMFLYTRPEVARNLVEYRYDTLPGARKKARDLGYYGAFYAWTSGKTGEELFPDYFFTDVLTGRKLHNHFNSWQIHISPDIVYALWLYYEVAGDWEFMLDYGAEIAFEVAQFLVSRIHFKKDKHRYELIRLLGPDEYHENVDNNVYTMYLAKFAFEKALIIFRRMATENPEQLDALLAKIGIDRSATEDWQDIVDLIYLPQPDPETKLIEQFDGFFQLEDVTPAELRARLLHPEEYWGWPNGVAVEAQVLKQADVLQLFALLDIFPPDVMRANYEYYEPRTEHGSSLSPSVHALIATKAGLHDAAYRYFMEASTIDLYNMSKKVMSGGSFLGGIHTAACGGVWLMLVRGFAGFEVHGDRLRFNPVLPATWTSLSFALTFRYNVLRITITPDTLQLSSDEGNPAPVHVLVGEQEVVVAPGQRVAVTI
ncbi:MAG: glycoside hydrolase family 65 protein [Anaerolineae bacterium]|nr:glycoside hydrolase family 65 protein [Anaerolineae bacterium]